MHKHEYNAYVSDAIESHLKVCHFDCGIALASNLLRFVHLLGYLRLVLIPALVNRHTFRRKQISRSPIFAFLLDRSSSHDGH